MENKLKFIAVYKHNIVELSKSKERTGQHDSG